MPTLSIDKHIPVPLYYQLKNVLRAHIKENHEPDRKFFSERELADKCRVSRITVGRTINDLVNEGFLYRIQGKGTFVADPEKKKTNNVGFILAQRLASLPKRLTQIFYSEFLEYIESDCRDDNYHLFLL